MSSHRAAIDELVAVLRREIGQPYEQLLAGFARLRELKFRSSLKERVFAEELHRAAVGISDALKANAGFSKLPELVWQLERAARREAEAE